MSEQIDDNYVNGVYVKADGTEQVEINPQYVYMTVPSKYVCVYHKLLVLMAQYGLDMLNDCSATCKGNNKNIVTCWNMFQSAMAAYQLGQDKLAETLLKYIKGQLNIIYEDSEQVQYSGSITLPIDEEGKIHAIVSCGDAPKFYVGRNEKKVKNIMKLIVLVMFIMIMNNVNVFHPLRGVYTMNLVNLENV